MAGLIAHGTANAFVPLFPVLIMEDGVPQIRFWIWTFLSLIIGIVFLIKNINNSKRITLGRDMKSA